MMNYNPLNTPPRAHPTRRIETPGAPVKQVLKSPKHFQILPISREKKAEFDRFLATPENTLDDIMIPLREMNRLILFVDSCWISSKCRENQSTTILEAIASIEAQCYLHAMWNFKNKTKHNNFFFLSFCSFLLLFFSFLDFSISLSHCHGKKNETKKQQQQDIHHHWTVKQQHNNNNTLSQRKRCPLQLSIPRRKAKRRHWQIYQASGIHSSIMEL